MFIRMKMKENTSQLSRVQCWSALRLDFSLTSKVPLKQSIRKVNKQLDKHLLTRDGKNNGRVLFGGDVC